MSDTSTHPVTGSAPESKPAKPLVDCCGEPTCEVVAISNEGNRGEVEYECASCGTSFTEVHTIRYIEREDGERQEANQSSYCSCDDEWFTTVWSGKTGSRTLEFVGECGVCGTLYADVYKYVQNEYR